MTSSSLKENQEKMMTCSVLLKLAGLVNCGSLCSSLAWEEEKQMMQVLEPEEMSSIVWQSLLPEVTFSVFSQENLLKESKEVNPESMESTMRFEHESTSFYRFALAKVYAAWMEISRVMNQEAEM